MAPTVLYHRHGLAYKITPHDSYHLPDEARKIYMMNSQADDSIYLHKKITQNGSKFKEVKK